MTRLLTSFWNPNWDQFWPSIIATGIGFILAVLFQQLLYEVIKNKIVNDYKAKCLIKDIKKELERCLYFINSQLKFDKSYLNPIKTPIWDGAINNNEIQLLTKYKKVKVNKLRNKLINNSECKDTNKYFLNKIGANKKHINIYDRLFTVYGAISDFNGWYNVSSDKKAQGIDEKTEEKILGFLKLQKNDLAAETCLDGQQKVKEEYKKSVFILFVLISCIVNEETKITELRKIELKHILAEKDFE